MNKGDRNAPPSNLEHRAIADIVLGSKNGGIVAWVRRDEVLPRVSIRQRGGDMDIVEAASLLGALRLACRHAEAAIAKDMNIEPHVLSEMAEIAAAALNQMVRGEEIRTPVPKDPG